jgi:uncharacterized protein (DUF427 family)
MSTRPIKVPGPDHPISIEKNPETVRIGLAGQSIGETRNALALREASYPAVQYVPRADVDMTLLQRTEHSTYCPYKGVCSYFSIPSGGARLENAVWSYESPHDAVAEIKDHLAFYPDRVQISVGD